MTREKLFSITSSDFRWDYYRGTGAGGQKRNKTENCCRCTHEKSGAVATSEDGRSKEHNKKEAFKKCVNSVAFRAWLKLEISKKSGLHKKIQKIVEEKLENETTVSTQNETGEWIPNHNLSINHYDIIDLREQNDK